MIIKYPSYTSDKIAEAEVGRCYLVSLPVALQCPFIASQTLVAHKSIDGKGWTVTHLQSGMQFARGSTKKDSIDNTLNRFSYYDKDEIISAMERGIAIFNSRTDTKQGE